MQQKKVFSIITLFVSVVFFAQASLPEGFSYAKDYIPDLEIDLRYATKNNFVGQKIEGYRAKKAILSTKMLQALYAAQKEFGRMGLGLKLFDGYRPQRAVNHFMRWAKHPADTLKKAQFYPNISKSDLFKKHYISTRSGHSRGSSVDLTLIDFNSCKELDMGSPYDFFGAISNLDYQDLNQKQRANRKLLQRVMIKHGFRAYAKEWWHFTLNNEPFPNTYFDFIIE
jgi:D-alanyl-D-alanine dipeptidase